MTTTSSTAPSSTLISSLRAETTKMFTLRSTLVWAILLTGSIFGPVTLLVLFGKDGVELNWGDLMTGYSIFQLIAVIFAAAFTAGDIRNHLHAQAFLTQAKRWHWVVSKVIVVALFSAVTFIVGAALAVVVAALFGGNLALGVEEQHLYVALFSVVIFAAMTVGLSCVIRGQVASVAVPVTWILVIDGMIGLAAEHISVFRPLAMIAPNQRITQLFAGASPAADPLNLGLNTAVCYLIIIGWFVALTGIGLWRNQRSDIR